MSKAQKIILVVILLAAVFAAWALSPNGNPRPKGVAESLNFRAATNSSTTCAGVSTSIVATTTGRTSFVVSILPTATNTVTICRDATCVINAGWGNLSVTSSPRFEQFDGYTGPYSCIASTASTSIGYNSSQ